MKDIEKMLISRDVATRKLARDILLDKNDELIILFTGWMHDEEDKLSGRVKRMIEKFHRSRIYIYAGNGFNPNKLKRYFWDIEI